VILFVCQHGSAKSLIAATHLNRLAEQRGLPVRATSAGLEPDAEVPQHVIDGLANDGIDVLEYRPALLTSAKLLQAARIISIGCDVESIATGAASVERWYDLPMVSDGYENARNAIVARVAQLLDTWRPPMRFLSRHDVRALLDVTSCIEAVEAAFRLHAAGASIGPGVLATHVIGGGFHVKAAGLTGKRAYYAAKVNGNFPDNPRSQNLPTIQGVITLFDATNGTPLAIMDSIEITCLRTAAASAIAAKYLSRDDAQVLTIIGCGAQALPHVRALSAVRSLRRVFAYDIEDRRVAALVRDAEQLGIEITVVAADYHAAVRVSDMVVTCTPGRVPLLTRGDLPEGAFLAAVGADSEDKRELDPSLLADSAVVVDILEQCATIGELHHAVAAGVLTRDDVRGDLASLVSGQYAGRRSRHERVIFDSTGTALQDVAAAAVVYERACNVGAGTELQISE